jgi:glutamyl/glutaminyl-tRNA synthetase
MLRPDLVAAARSLTSPPVTRFAPSPTGYLHLGHIVNAIYTWGIARALGGRVLLRLEDHDRIRSRAAYEAAIVEDLVDTLKRTTHVYACDCSRTDVGGERYVGRCRTRGLSYVPGHGVRVQFNPKTVHAHDLLAGPLAQVPSEQCGDLLLRDRDGNWTYQFAVTVDDVRHGVTLVIRGADLLASTGRQVLLAEMLGRPTPPVFLHHPLIMGRGGEKLSKSAGNTGVRELRAQGLGPEDVIGRAAAAIGLIASPRAIRASEVASLFL